MLSSEIWELYHNCTNWMMFNTYIFAHFSIFIIIVVWGSGTRGGGIWDRFCLKALQKKVVKKIWLSLVADSVILFWFGKEFYTEIRAPVPVTSLNGLCWIVTVCLGTFCLVRVPVYMFNWRTINKNVHQFGNWCYYYGYENRNWSMRAGVLRAKVPKLNLKSYLVIVKTLLVKGLYKRIAVPF